MINDTELERRNRLSTLCNTAEIKRVQAARKVDRAVDRFGLYVSIQMVLNALKTIKSYKLRDVIAMPKQNDDELLIRCPECLRENWGIAVYSGKCVCCGYKKERKKYNA